MTENGERPLLTARLVAQMFGCTTQNIYKLGDKVARRRIAGRWYYDPDDVAEELEARTLALDALVYEATSR